MGSPHEALGHNHITNLWVMAPSRGMGYGVSEVYGFCPLSQLGMAQNLWDIREYGLPGLWVKRESTVFREQIPVGFWVESWCVDIYAEVCGSAHDKDII